MEKYNKAVNAFRLAMGTACYCKSCQVLMTYGVNSAAAMRAIGVPSQVWVGWLKAHAAYHTAKGEELPIEWTVAGLSDEFKANVLAPKPRVSKPIFVRPVLSEEERAIAKLRSVCTTKQANARVENRPIIKRLDPTPFKGF